jgi:ketosteroid isomerase-like protein
MRSSLRKPGPIAFEAEDLRITVSGDVGYSHQIQHFKGTYNGKPVEACARCTDVYRKISGKWLIVEEHISVSVDLDTGKFDLMSKP